MKKKKKRDSRKLWLQKKNRFNQLSVLNHRRQKFFLQCFAGFILSILAILFFALFFQILFQ